jgi:hypothetical protein
VNRSGSSSMRPIVVRNTLLTVVFLIAQIFVADRVFAQSLEDESGCLGTTDDPCIRTGTCSIQGATWAQTVTIDRSDLYDTMGWAGVCDQVHVALVQGNCEPGGPQINVTVFLQANSSASIPEIVGPLTCNAPPPAAIPAMGARRLVALASGLFAMAIRTVRRRSPPPLLRSEQQAYPLRFSVLPRRCAARSTLVAAVPVLVGRPPLGVEPSALRAPPGT